jgi:capsular exopolysaccharide synthesis family protein
MTNNLQKMNSQALSEDRYSYGGYGYHQEKEDTIDFRSMWQLLKSYKWSIIFITFLTFIVTLFVSLSLTPSYRAVGTIHIQRAVEKVTSHKVNAQQQDITDKDFYQTQYEFLKSKTLASRVLDKLGIRNEKSEIPSSEKEEQGRSIFSDLISKIKVWLFDIEKILGLNISTLFSFPEEKINLGKISRESQFLGNLKIIPLKDSQIVTIQFDDSDPEVASKIVNSIASEFVAMNMERRSESTIYAKDFLKTQLNITKLELDKKERVLAAYAKKHSLITTGNNEALVDKRLVELSLAVTLAENIRIEMESRYENNSIGVDKVTINPALDNSVMVTLKARKAQKLAEFQDKLKIFKADYPDMKRLKRRINQIQRDINKEQKRINQAVRTERSINTNLLRNAYLAALQKEKKLKKSLNQQEDKSFVLKDKKIEYTSLQREVDTSRDLYQGLLKREKEVKIASVGGKNNISIVDKAEVPYRQFKPNLKINIPIGIMIGLFLGVGLSFLRNIFNDTVKSSEEIEKLSMLPILGTVPKIKTRAVKSQAMLTFTKPQSAIAEACRSLRTTLLFSTDGDPKVLLITSPMPNEGKTTTAVNLASAFVQAGKKVLLIDADLRKPSLHRRLKLANTMGLASCLVGECEVEDAIYPKVLGELSVLTAGTISNSPVGLFSSEKMAALLRELSLTYDNIILDAPPVMGLADALVLAHVSSATLMVASHGQTNRKMLIVACNKIRQAQGHLVGCVYTKVGTYDDGYSQDLYAYGNRKYGLVS